MVDGQTKSQTQEDAEEHGGHRLQKEDETSDKGSESEEERRRAR